MQQRSRLILNSLVNTGGRVVAVAIRFVVVPFAIGIMGRTHYGLWVVVGQILAYTRILDMGLRSAVQRQVALRTGGQDPEGLNRYVNTAAGYYCAVGLLIVLVAAVVALLFTDLFEVEPQYHWHARGMVLVAGLTLACSIPQNAYSAVLSGLQRFDIISGTTVVADLLRAGIIFGLLSHFGIGWGLILLAVASGGSELVGAVLRTLSSLRLCKHVTFRPWQGDRSLLGGMVAFGFQTILFVMSTSVAWHLAQILIGACISTAQATDFSLAVLVVAVGNSFVLPFGVSAQAAASRYQSQDNTPLLRHLLLRSTRYGNFVTLAGICVLVLFPDALFHLWMGGNYTKPEELLALDRIADTCRILTIGSGLFWLMLPGFNVANGMGQHRFPARAALLEVVASITAVAITASREGATIDQVAWALVIPAIPIRALILPWYWCRIVQQPRRRYAWEGFILPALSCLPAAVVAFWFNRYHPAAGWWTLAWQLGGFGLVAAACGWFLVLAADDRAHMIRSAVGLLRRFRPGAAE